MTTLTHTHTPHMESISTVNETQFTFCEDCETNIFRYWLEFDGDRLDMWSDWIGQQMNIFLCSSCDTLGIVKYDGTTITINPCQCTKEN